MYWTFDRLIVSKGVVRMSKTKIMPVTCPSCGKDSDFTVWESINTMLDPEMKAKVRDGSAFTFECPHCGAKVQVEYDCLYHQMEDRMMIHYASSDQSAEDLYKFFTGVVPSDMFTEFRKGGYLIRIVRSMNQLLEKLMIFDHGLDDRMIEICKLFILIKLQEENRDKDYDLLYFFNDGKHYMEVFEDGKAIGKTEFSQDFYEKIRDEIGKDMPEIRKDDIIIDRQWALEHLQHNSERNRS